MIITAIPDVIRSKTKLTDLQWMLVDAILTQCQKGELVFTLEDVLAVMTGTSELDLTEAQRRQIHLLISSMGYTELIYPEVRFSVHFKENPEPFFYQRSGPVIPVTSLENPAAGKTQYTYEVSSPHLYKYLDAHDLLFQVPDQFAYPMPANTCTPQTLLLLSVLRSWLSPLLFGVIRMLQLDHVVLSSDDLRKSISDLEPEISDAEISATVLLLCEAWKERGYLAGVTQHQDADDETVFRISLPV